MRALETIDSGKPDPAPDDSVWRICNSLGVSSASQALTAIWSVAGGMRPFVSAGALRRVSQALHGECRQAILGASEAASTLPPGTEASLVMHVASILPRGFPAHACAVVRVVLAEIAEQAGPAETGLLISAMPARLRKLWPPPVWKASDAAHAA